MATTTLALLDEDSPASRERDTRALRRQYSYTARNDIVIQNSRLAVLSPAREVKAREEDNNDPPAPLLREKKGEGTSHDTRPQ